MEYLLGIDIGTSGAKTVLFDSTGEVSASKTLEYPLYQPKNGWAEQDPEDWWNAVSQGIRFVVNESGIRASSIRGVGLSGQMHGLVMLDKDGKILRKAIIWCDQRTDRECVLMNRLVGEHRLMEIAANPALTGFTASKILWVKRNQPKIYEKCAHILLPKDYIRYRLTGEFATDVSDAAGMQLMDVPHRCWSKEILEKLGIDGSLLAKIYESPEITGQVHREAASMTGLSTGTPVAGGAGDNSAAAVGTGVVKSGKAFTTLGTSGVVYTITDKVSIDPEGRIHTFCAPIPGKWTLMSCTQAAGLSLKWFKENFCEKEILNAENQKIDPYILMDREADSIPCGSDGILYLPYLMGERSPHPNPNCRGVFFGLSAIHTRAHLIRAVMEGVGYSQLECVDVFRELNCTIESMILCGGGAKSRIWRQILSDMYACPVDTLQAEEGPALGAAILAGAGCGMFSSVEEGCDRIIHKKSTLQPILPNHKIYEAGYRLYKKLYLDLKDDFDLLHQI